MFIYIHQLFLFPISKYYLLIRCLLIKIYLMLMLINIIQINYINIETL